MRCSIHVLVISFGLLAASNDRVYAQASDPRNQMLLAAGIGAGKLNCGSCEGDANGLTVNLAAGRGISRRLVLGVVLDQWTGTAGKSGDALRFAGTFGRFYPKVSGFHITAALGIAHIAVKGVTESYSSPTSLGGSVDAGYDVKVGTRVMLTPFARAVGGTFDGLGGSYSSLGASVTVR